MAIIILLSLLALFLVLSAVPYLLRVTAATSERTVPFPESVFAVVDGVLLHSRLWRPDGARSRGKILLVHGLGGSTFSWRNNAEALAGAGYVVLAADLPGFGYSDRRRGLDHSQESRSRLLWHLLERVDSALEQDVKDAPWHLAGHSMGGGTVVMMALGNPARTRSVFLADGAVLTRRASLRFFLRYPPAGRWIEGLARQLFFKKKRLARFLESAYGTKPSDAAVDGYLRPLLLDGTEGALLDMTQTATTLKADALKALTAPVSAVWGGRDTWVPVAEAHQLQAILPEMRLDVISEGGHCANETHSGAFNQYLLEALDRAVPASAGACR